MKTNEPIAMKTMINTNGSNGSESKMAVQSGPIVLDSSKIVIRTGINLQKMSFRFCMPKKYNAEKQTVQG